MRGRKREPGAVRDGRDPATELARAEEVPVSVSPNLDAPASKPADVGAVECMSAMWDQLVGDGSAYREQDVPLLTQWVYWTELARQIQGRMTLEDGRVATLTDAWQGDDLVQVESPYVRQLKTATDMSLKLAEHFGGTPMARARLGLTRAATASIGEDIRRKVISAMREASRGA